MAVLITGAERAGGTPAVALPRRSTRPGHAAPGRDHPGHAPGAAGGWRRLAAVGRVTWKSLKPEVATVDSAGLVIGVTTGHEHRAGQRRPDGLMATLPGRGRAGRHRAVGASGRAGAGGRGHPGVACPVAEQPRASAAAFSGNRPTPRSRASDSTGHRHGAGAGPDGDRLRRLRTGAPGGGAGAPAPADAGRHAQADGRRRSSSRSSASASSRPSRRRRTARRFPRRESLWTVGDTAGGRLRSRPPGRSRARHRGRPRSPPGLHGFDPVIWPIQVVPGILGLDRTRVGLGRGADDLAAPCSTTPARPSAGRSRPVDQRPPRHRDGVAPARSEAVEPRPCAW